MIWLSEMQRQYLELKLSKILKSDFVGTEILKKIKIDREREEKQKNCKHEIKNYAGKRDCCAICGGFPEGCGESWIITNF